MREIKFRVWIDVFKEMVYDIDVGGGISFKNEPIKLNGFLKAIRPMQYTDLKDKDGVEIYEGDILSNEDGNVYTVEFVDGSFMVIHKYRKLSDIHHLNYYIQNISMCEVIGNIYENSELLATS